MIKIVLEDSGIDPERFALEWASAEESTRFAQIVTDFTEKVRALGPNPNKPKAVEVESATEPEPECETTDV